jgi:hypothetical protein
LVGQPITLTEEIDIGSLVQTAVIDDGTMAPNCRDHPCPACD